jgi:hypothetical protein
MKLIKKLALALLLVPACVYAENPSTGNPQESNGQSSVAVTDVASVDSEFFKAFVAFVEQNHNRKLNEKSLEAFHALVNKKPELAKFILEMQDFVNEAESILTNNQKDAEGTASN